MRTNWELIWLLFREVLERKTQKSVLMICIKDYLYIWKGYTFKAIQTAQNNYRSFTIVNLSKNKSYEINKFFFWYYLFHFDFLRKAQHQLDKIKQQDLKMIILWTSTPLGRRGGNGKCELLFGWLPVKLVLTCRKMEPFPSPLKCKRALV
jgi:hypothetical protein